MSSWPKLFAAKSNSRKSIPPQAKAAHKAAGKPKGLLARITGAADRLAFSWPIREMLYRHIATQVSNGVSVEVALDTFRARLQRRKKPSSDKIVAKVARSMRNGSTLAGALDSWIPPDEAGIVSGGELSGNLPRALDLIIEAKRRVVRINTALKSSLVSPTIYVLLVYGMLWAIGRFVTPGFVMILPESRAQGLVYGLYVAGDFANSWWVVLPPIVLGILITLVARSLSKWTGPRRIAAEKVFPYSTYRDLNGYIWLMSFATLLRAGVADVEILKRQARQASPWLKERLRAFRLRMDDGASLPSALMAKGRGAMPSFLFPNPDIIDDIASMDGFSDFPERISKLAMQWADELESAMLVRAKRFGFAMEMLMYVVMGLLMIAINSMSTQMGSVPGT